MERRTHPEALSGLLYVPVPADGGIERRDSPKAGVFVRRTRIPVTRKAKWRTWLPIEYSVENDETSELVAGFFERGRKRFIRRPAVCKANRCGVNRMFLVV
jgi:hypothetical protein